MSPLSLQDLFAPESVESFFDQRWEKDYLYIERSKPPLYDRLFRMEDIDRWLLATRDLSTQNVLLVDAAGSQTGAQRQASGASSMQELYRAYDAGSSIVLNSIERTWSPLAPLAQLLAEVFGAHININVYLTPPSSRVFPVHIDPHDVFILQLSGRKEWYLYELRDLPVKRLAYEAHLERPADEPLEERPLLRQMWLEEGDFLYVPRGMPHKAVTSETTHSLHLTVGIEPLAWADFLKAAVEQAALESPALQQALPPGYLQAAERRSGMESSFQQALEDLQGVSFEQILRVVLRDRISKIEYPPDGHVAQLDRLSTLNGDSVLERRVGLVCLVEKSPKSASIRFAKGHIRGPAALGRAFELIRDQPRFRVADLPGLSEKAGTTLCRRLVRDGLLRFASDETETVPRQEAVAAG